MSEVLQTIMCYCSLLQCANLREAMAGARLREPNHQRYPGHLVETDQEPG